MSAFDNRVGLVTGAGSGIGRASAVAFARRGAAVGVLDIVGSDAGETVRLIEEAGGRALAVEVDVGDEQAVADAVAEVVATFGGLDFAHNNAGISGTSALLEEVDIDDWDRVIRINLTSVLFSMKHELPHLVARGGGAIVNSSSNAGLFAVPAMPAYVASKHGVVGLTKSTALDYGPRGVRVNAICPGFIRTPLLESYAGTDEATYEGMAAITPLRRVGMPDDAADVAVWLCSDDARFVTGQAIVVDGGRKA